jgi:type III secretory pathway component EscT
MIIAGVMIAILLISAWLGLIAAAVLWMIEHGVIMASGAILLAVGVTLLLTLILMVVVHRKSRYLQFPATVRSLQPMPSLQRHHKKES